MAYQIDWVLDSIADMVVVIDRRYHYLYVNDAARSMMGSRGKHIEGKNMWEVFPEIKHQPIADQIKHSLSTKTPVKYEYYSQVAKKWLRTNLFPSRHGLVMISTDITVPKAFERRLQEQARMIQLTTDAVLLLDENDKIIFWNQGAEKLYGWTEIEAKGKIARELLHTHYSQPIETIIQILNTQGSWNGELEHVTKTNHQIVVDSHIEIFKDDQELTYLEINHDITKRKRLEEKKDEFMSIAAHELKTPLTSIKAYSQLIEKLLHKSDYPKIEILQHKQLVNIDKLNKLISDLLDVTKIKAGKLQLQKTKRRFTSIVNSAIDSVQSITNSHRIVKIGNGNVAINGDVNRLEQVIINLLTNAIKYSPQSTQVIVEVTHDHKQVTLAVTDYGIGIPQEEKGKLFDRYYRINNSTKAPGLGIGLYLSNEIVVRHGGKMWIDSTKNSGSTFYFSLPIK